MPANRIPPALITAKKTPPSNQGTLRRAALRAWRFPAAPTHGHLQMQIGDSRSGILPPLVSGVRRAAPSWRRTSRGATSETRSPQGCAATLPGYQRLDLAAAYCAALEWALCLAFEAGATWLPAPPIFRRSRGTPDRSPTATFAARSRIRRSGVLDQLRLAERYFVSDIGDPIRRTPLFRDRQNKHPTPPKNIGKAATGVPPQRGMRGTISRQHETIRLQQTGPSFRDGRRNQANIST